MCVCVCKGPGGASRIHPTWTEGRAFGARGETKYRWVWLSQKKEEGVALTCVLALPLYPHPHFTHAAQEKKRGVPCIFLRGVALMMM